MDEQEIKEHFENCLRLDKAIRRKLSSRYHNRDVMRVLSRIMLEIIMEQEDPDKNFESFKCFLEEYFPKIKQEYAREKENKA